MIVQREILIGTAGRGSTDVTARITTCVSASGVRQGLCSVFLAHTSASLMLCENADPEVRADLERFMQRLVPDGDPLFRHDAEGPDDMPAHVRSVLTQNSLVLPIAGGSCTLGTWQGIYLWEHRLHPQQRRIIVTINGD